MRGADALGCVDSLAHDPIATLQFVRAEAVAAPATIFPAADGRLWWVNSGSRTIARLDPSSPDPAATAETIPGAPVIGDARAWAADASGRIWLTAREPDALVRVDPRAEDPASTALVVRSPLVARPDNVWHGADGDIWFANPGAGSIGRLDPDADDPAATVRTFGGEDAAPQDPFDIKDGPDGWLWFTDEAGHALGRIYAGA